MENNIKATKDKIEVVYLQLWAGCMGTGMGLMTLAGLFILFYIVPNSSIAKGFMGLVIGIPGTLFFLIKLLQLVSVFLSGKTLLTIENGCIIGRKKSVAIGQIKDMYLGGLSFKTLFIRTIDNQTIKFNTFNLVTEEVIAHVIDTYVIPHATQELKTNWEKRRHNKSA